jgi:hypothetical protein
VAAKDLLASKADGIAKKPNVNSIEILDFDILQKKARHYSNESHTKDTYKSLNKSNEEGRLNITIDSVAPMFLNVAADAFPPYSTDAAEAYTEKSSEGAGCLVGRGSKEVPSMAIRVRKRMLTPSPTMRELKATRKASEEGSDNEKRFNSRYSHDRIKRLRDNSIKNAVSHADGEHDDVEFGG